VADGLEELGEFGVIRLFREAAAPGEGILKGIGDDCAVLEGPPGSRLLVTTDMLLEGVHFLREGTGPRDLGWKALASNLSDIAAMGGLPWGAFLAVGLPGDLPLSWLEEFREGLLECSSRYECPLLGGDTTSSEKGVVLCLTVLGRVPEGREIYRSGAKEGDLVFLGRPTGESAAGLTLLLHPPGPPLSREDRQVLLAAHNRPEPQVELGLLLSREGLATAMIDVSDGLLQDLGHICEESGLGARVEARKIPITPSLLRFAAASGKDPLEPALTGGEDYCLLFTLDPKDQARARKAARRELGIELHPVGYLTGGRKVLVGEGDRWEEWSRRGYDHFRD